MNSGHLKAYVELRGHKARGALYRVRMNKNLQIALLADPLQRETAFYNLTIGGRLREGEGMSPMKSRAFGLCLCVGIVVGIFSWMTPYHIAFIGFAGLFAAVGLALLVERALMRKLDRQSHLVTLFKHTRGRRLRADWRKRPSSS